MTQETSVYWMAWDLTSHGKLPGISVLNVAPTSDGDLRFDLRCRSLLGCHPSFVSPGTRPVGRAIELTAEAIPHPTAILMEVWVNENLRPPAWFLCVART